MFTNELLNFGLCQRHIAIHMYRVLMTASRCISCLWIPRRGQDDFKMALTLDVSSSERAQSACVNYKYTILNFKCTICIFKENDYSKACVQLAGR